VIEKLAFAPGIFYPSAKLVGTETDGKLINAGNGAVQSLYAEKAFAENNTASAKTR
jgi:hypothetical protein